MLSLTKGGITMATIKSYTNLQQSKKLAKVLPLESADMSWVSNGLGKPFARTIPIKGDPEELCACWSLAALLSVLPAECECMSLEHINYGNNYKEYFMHYIGGENTENYDNPVDACVAMIEGLHELNLL